MAYTRSFFIRKNTPEIRDILEKLGYAPSEYTDRGDIIFIDKRYSEYYLFSNKYFKGLIESYRHGIKCDFIDCSDNEELFFALAKFRKQQLNKL